MDAVKVDPRPWVDRPVGPERDLEDRIVAFMRARLEQMGPRNSGLYDYYVDRLAIPDPYARPERMLFHHIGSEQPETLVHVGCGIGMITARFAAMAYGASVTRRIRAGWPRPKPCGTTLASTTKSDPPSTRRG